MKDVKIICGAYGHHIGGIVKPIYKGQTVTLPDAEAEYLVKTGAGEIIAHEADGAPAPATGGEWAGGNLSEEPETEETAILATTDGPLEEMSFNELKQLAIKIGIEDIGKYRSKAALIAVIEENTMSPDEITDEAPPELTASEVM